MDNFPSFEMIQQYEDYFSSDQLLWFRDNGNLTDDQYQQILKEKHGKEASV
ncbi:hypothetical protein M3M39_04850 [Fructilactobacillus hinvesii]|uniref:XkdX family protein n=1 Tax=Fructilactobacillus hinvesii TaxID=2940300 RepID=A0ABY5BSN2_9LACO|nr:hypothetical protein [Fructilactobacillus hinvesii]USS87452.1 hypothetical protein M3M39_04850 [Fructilactobacillus hinvesii]